MYTRMSEGSEQETDMGRALNLNRCYARSLGWQAHLPKIQRFLGLAGYTLDERTFAEQVARWQRYRGLPADGIIGPAAWSRMRASLGIPKLAQPLPPVWSGLGQAKGDFLEDIRAELPHCSLNLLPFRTKTPCTVALGKSSSKVHEVRAYFFPGTSREKAMVIAGVHGSELSGIEVVQCLVKKLFEDSKGGARPHFDVTIVPELFPDNAARARDHARRLAAERKSKKEDVGLLGEDSNVGRRTQGSDVDPNRQLPELGQPFNGSNPVDSLNRTIERENQYLLNLIQTLKPKRIANVHANRNPVHSGIFADPHSWPGTATNKDKTDAEERTFRDAALALAMARRAEKGGANVRGNRLNMSCEKSECPVWLYPVKPPRKGVSLGEWGPREVPVSRGAISVITVEVQHYYSTDLIGLGGTPVRKQTQADVKNRQKEFAAHRDALVEVFLGQQ